jgi:hypothetical protein
VISGEFNRLQPELTYHFLTLRVNMRDFYHSRLTLMGVDSRVLTVTACAKLLNLMAPLFLDGRLKPAKISKRGSLQDAPELYSYVNRSGGGKAVLVFD